MIFSFYFPIILSLSLSFLLHAFKKHIHSFVDLALATTFNNTINKLHLIKCHQYLISSTTATTTRSRTAKPLSLPPPMIVDIDGLMACTESTIELIESINIKDEKQVVVDQKDHGNDDDGGYNSDDEFDDDDDCWRRKRMGAAEGRGNSFPPPLSSLDSNGQPSFILLPVRKDGRLQLSQVRIKRPEIVYAARQDGRLRLYLVPDLLDDVEQEEEECDRELEEQQQQQQLVEDDDVAEPELEGEETIVEYSEEEVEVEVELVEEEVAVTVRKKIGTLESGIFLQVMKGLGGVVAKW